MRLTQLLYNHQTDEDRLQSAETHDVTIEALRNSLNHFYSAVVKSPTATAITDIDGQFLFVNEMFSALTGYEDKELMGHTADMLQAAAVHGRTSPVLLHQLCADTVWQGELDGSKKNGENARFTATIYPLKNDQNEVIGHVTYMESYIESSMESSMENIHAETASSAKALPSTLDHLTGLLNRSAFDVSLGEILRQSQFGGVRFSLILFDIDGFNTTNKRQDLDSCDHSLHELATTLRKCLRTRDTLCRWSEREFAVLLYETPIDQAQVIAARIRRAVASGAGAGQDVAISFGVTHYQHDDRAETLLSRVSQSLHRAKSIGGNQILAD